jgi:hypothetical protein
MNELKYTHSEENETYPIYEFPNFLNKQEIEFFIDYIEKAKSKQKIIVDEKIAKIIEDKIYQSNFPDSDAFCGCAKEITVSKHKAPFHVGPHKDQRKDEGNKKNLKKLIIYLDEDNENPNSGGTVFLDKNNKTVATLNREKGKAGLFDIRQLHEGQDLTKGIKYLLGARLLYV